MKFKLMAVAALALSAGAHAATFDLGTVGGTAPLGNIVLAGSFADTINFSLASLSTVSVNVFNIYADSTAFTLGKISFFAASLDGVPLTLSTTTTPILPGTDVVTQKLLLSDAPKLAGPHTLTIGGDGDSFIQGYIGSISVTAVPEPETYALMLAGLGAIGMLIKRRSV